MKKEKNKRELVDNPVPSLEELANEFIKNDEHGSLVYHEDYLLEFVKYVNKQNGLETNKEKPKWTCDMCGNSQVCNMCSSIG